MKFRKGSSAGEAPQVKLRRGSSAGETPQVKPPSHYRHLDIDMSLPSHKIFIEPNSLLHRIVQKNEIEINSSHHQAVKSVGSKMIVSATAEDGIIEAIEMPDYTFVLGIEWHPEFEVSESDTHIIGAFVNAARICE